MNKSYGLIILAAGSSSRMGQSKQLLPVDGEPLLSWSVKVAIDSGLANIAVVLGANEKEHRKLIAGLPIQVISNSTWEKGIGNSLKAGVENMIRDKPTINGVVIMVCDQPRVSAGHIKNLLARHEETAKPIIASGYGQSAGVPAFFENRYFPALLKLDDNQGAKQLILKNHADMDIVDFPEGLTDLDTKEDYLKYINKK